jgi:hypothetical protein
MQKNDVGVVSNSVPVFIYQPKILSSCYQIYQNQMVTDCTLLTVNQKRNIICQNLGTCKAKTCAQANSNVRLSITA